MDTYQLRYALINLITKVPVGVCASDQLSSITLDEFAIISNTESSDDEGLHWVCFYKTAKMKHVDYFDSVGNDVLKYNTHFRNFASKFAYVQQCKTQFQSSSSDVCGKYCIWFLVKRSKGYSFKTLISGLSSTNRSKNDLNIKSFLKQIKFPIFSECGGCAICNNDSINSYCMQKNKTCYNIKQWIRKKL